MLVNVMLLGYGEGQLRPVNIPDEEKPEGMDTLQLLERVFYWGQNDFQPLPDRYSVSVGDVALLNGQFWVVRPMGWAELTPAEFQAYLTMEQRDRVWSQYARPE